MIVEDRFTFKTLIDNHQFADKSITRTNKTWIEEYKENLREKQRFWKEEKIKSSTNKLDQAPQLCIMIFLNCIIINYFNYYIKLIFQ